MDWPSMHSVTVSFPRRESLGYLAIEPNVTSSLTLIDFNKSSAKGCPTSISTTEREVTDLAHLKSGQWHCKRSWFGKSTASNTFWNSIVVMGLSENGNGSLTLFHVHL
jgi:hypothetical protein